MWGWCTRGGTRPRRWTGSTAKHGCDTTRNRFFNLLGTNKMDMCIDTSVLWHPDGSVSVNAFLIEVAKKTGKKMRLRIFLHTPYQTSKIKRRVKTHVPRSDN